MTRTRRAAAFGGFAATRQDSGIAKRSLFSPARLGKPTATRRKWPPRIEVAIFT